MIEEVRLQWIDAEDCKPPECVSVLLYVEMYNKNYIDKGYSYYWDYRLLSGFYSDDIDENPSFYVDTIDGYEKIEESQFMKVRKWTLLPKPPKHKKRIKVVDDLHL